MAGLGSALVGAMDGFLVAMRDRFAPGERLFRDGFGDVVSTCAAYGNVLERIRRGTNPLNDFRPAFRVATPRVARPPPKQSGCTCRRTRHTPAAEKEKLERASTLPNAASLLFESELAYESPWSAHLPSEVRAARALWLSASPYADAFKATVAGGGETGAESSLAAAAVAATASPVATSTPLSSVTATASATASAAEPSAIVLHMPAFGEEGYGSRKDCARALALEDDAVNLILMAPFYGERRRAGQASSSPLTVADMINQSFAISMEAAALIRWAAGRWPTAKLLVTGFSYGGAMTGTGGTFAAACLAPADRARLGVVPCIGSCSPVVLLEGVLRSSVGWEALERSQPSSTTSSSATSIAGAAGARKDGTAAGGAGGELSAALLPAAAEALASAGAPSARAVRSPVPLPVMPCSDRAELARLLQAPAIVAAHDVASLLHGVLAGVRLNLLLDIVMEGSATAAAAAAAAAPASSAAGAARNPRHLFGAVSSVAAAHDEFVRPRFTLEQHDCLATGVPAPHAATIVTVGGGHVAAFVRRKALFVPAVRRALAILAAAPGPA